MQIIKKASSIALAIALAATPVSIALGQSPKASQQGQENGQGTPARENSNAGSNLGVTPGNNASQVNPSASRDTAAPAAGPEEGHTCGGNGHIDNNHIPGHQNDDCHAEGGAIGTNSVTGLVAPGAHSGSARNADLPVANMTGGNGSTASNCISFEQSLLPIFGTLTQEEADVVAGANTAALIPVDCPDLSTDPDAQQAVAVNPGLIRALESEGYGLHQVITLEVNYPVPTIYVEAAE